MSNLREHEIYPTMTMGGWFIDETICDKLIEFYKINSHLQTPGIQYDSGKGAKENENVKASTDIHLQPEFNCYPINLYKDALQKTLNEYVKVFDEANKMPRFSITESINIQHYKKGGGFKTWHYEYNPHHNFMSKRVLVFMTYLNDVEDGGTEFKYQNIKTPAKKGLTLIWPPYWTHTHRSQVSNTKEKYIITGWYSLLDSDKNEND